MFELTLTHADGTQTTQQAAYTDLGDLLTLVDDLLAGEAVAVTIRKA